MKTYRWEFWRLKQSLLPLPWFFCFKSTVFFTCSWQVKQTTNHHTNASRHVRHGGKFERTWFSCQNKLTTIFHGVKYPKSIKSNLIVCITKNSMFLKMHQLSKQRGRHCTVRWGLLQTSELNFSSNPAEDITQLSWLFVYIRFISWFLQVLNRKKK